MALQRHAYTEQVRGRGHAGGGGRADADRREGNGHHKGAGIVWGSGITLGLWCLPMLVLASCEQLTLCLNSENYTRSLLLGIAGIVCSRGTVAK